MAFEVVKLFITCKQIAISQLSIIKCISVVTSDMFLDVSKDITLAEFPCSWADGKNLRFQPFSINKEKVDNDFCRVHSLPYLWNLLVKADLV